MDEILALIEDLAALHNKALSLGINLEKFTNEAGKLLNEKLDNTFAEERDRILSAFRRPPSDKIQ